MVDDLPPIDPNRTHLDILRDALDILKRHPPRDVNRRGDVDCGSCGFPLNNAIAGEKHSEHVHPIRREACVYLRAVAELQAWVRVEEALEVENQERLNGW